MSDERKACCRDAENLGEPIRVNDSTVYRRCVVCNCRHFEMTLDPGVLGLKGAALRG